MTARAVPDGITVSRPDSAIRDVATGTPPARSTCVRIGTLRVPGVDASYAARIGVELRTELARLIATSSGGGFGRSLDRTRIDAGTLRVDASERPETAGRRLAASVARALSAATTRVDDAGADGVRHE